jgi:hypothetical protein
MMLCPRTCRRFAPLSSTASFLSLALLLTLAGTGGCSSANNRTERAERSDADSLSPQAARLARLTTAEVAEATRGLSPAARFDVIDAWCPVPIDWVLQPMKEGKNHKHLTWISPTGRTAFGVIYASLPFPAAFVPVSYRLDKVFEGFMSEMKKREGRSELIDRRNDYHAGMIHFVAEGSQYRLRVNLVVRGGRAWFIYAGTRRGEAPDPRELDLADRARDQTDVGEK